VAESPSDTAPALIALDAEMVIRSSGGERVVAARDYFVGPGVNIMRMTVLRPGELLTAIRIPATWAGAQFYFEKVRDRQVWDFPLVNVASALKVSGGNITDARIVVGAVAATPKRLDRVEAAVVGQPRNEETARMAGDMATDGAVTLRYNAYKVPLMRNLVKRAIRGGPAAATT
jgi:xanthine dehydrogenase YagS FAD-binding subunit